jgi:hypothetical protein
MNAPASDPPITPQSHPHSVTNLPFGFPWQPINRTLEPPGLVEVSRQILENIKKPPREKKYSSRL